MSNKPTEDTKVVFRDFDPNTTVLTNVNSTNWLDMSDWGRVMVVAFRTSGTGNARLVLKCSAASAGSSSATVSSIGTTSCTGLLNAASNGSIGNPGCGMLVVDATYDDVTKALEGARYVGAQIECTTQTDEFGVAYIFSEPRTKTSGLTATGNSV